MSTAISRLPAPPKPAALKAIPLPKPTRLYFVNTLIDVGMVGGISILTFVLFRCLHEGATTPAVLAWSTQLMWFCNWPHFSATSYRLYHIRDNVMQYPVTALVIPWIILAAMIGSLLAPVIVAPYFVKLFIIWSSYHFSGQSLGISLIYARRCGFRVGRWERFAVSNFIFGTFLTATARGEADLRGNEFYGIHYPGLGLPPVVITGLEVWMYAMAALFLVLAARWSWQNGRLLAPVVMLPAVTQYVWFVLGPSSQAFYIFVPFFHSLQYMLIAWSMQLKEKMDQRQIAPSPRYVVVESLRWGILNLAGGALLFFVFPHVVSSLSGRDLFFTTGVVISAVQIHHFFVDGVIWKLKRKTVASPLMVNIDDLLGRAPVAA
jgi:hypothetical protein